MNVHLYLTRPATLTKPMYRAITGLLEHEGITVHVTVDAARVAELTHGKVNPSTGLIGLTEDGTLLWSIYDLVRWIEKRGLARGTQSGR